MNLKSPTEPVVLSEKSFDWLEKKLAKNQARTGLNKHEKELFDGAEKLKPQARSLIQ